MITAFVLHGDCTHRERETVLVCNKRTCSDTIKNGARGGSVEAITPARKKKL